MSAFRFRLQSVLRQRSALRDERRGQLAEALRLRAELDERISRLNRELAELRGHCQREAVVGIVRVDNLVDAQRYESHLRGEQASLDLQRQAVTREVERRRAVLVEADRDLRVLEKLREARQTRHVDDERRREAASFDELARLLALREDPT
jgi:flagellar FliJ protein